ncbi:putative transcription factor interactor and regulator AUX-IAA family [Helianthus anomalus]
MASDPSPTYLLNHSDLHSLYYQTNNETGGIIDLGLSLRVLQPPTYDHSEHPHDDYHDLVEWNQLHPYESSDTSVGYPRKTTDNVVDEGNMFQRSKHQGDFVKVNMDGVLIGRKICVLDHSSYLSLASQLEEMFGKQALCSLQLFESGSDFSLWYKNRDEQWRIAGDVPWKEFVDSVTRMRIMFKDETLFRSMNTSV